MTDNAKELLALADCPVGLFMSNGGELCLKTEYGNNDGRIDAYIVSSGEFFWGDHPQTIANQRRQLVTPIDHEELLRLSVRQQASVEEVAQTLDPSAFVDLGPGFKRAQKIETELVTLKARALLAKYDIFEKVEG